MTGNFLIKRIFIVALLFCVLSKYSYADNDSFTVNLPDGQGGYKAVILKQSGAGYIGPAGEHYATFPSVSQLQIVYGSGPTQNNVTQNVVIQNVATQNMGNGLDQVSQDKIVQVPGDNGIVSVEIKEINGVYIGPLGERYYDFPTLHELQLNYGNVSNEQIQGSFHDPVIREHLLENQMTRHGDEEQAKIDQQNKQFADMVAKNNAAAEAQQKAQQEQQTQPVATSNPTEGGHMGALIFPLILLGAFLYWARNVYNQLVFSRENVRKGLGQIDVQLKRRHDLISNLVEVAKGYMAHEKDTLEKVTQARQTAVGAVSADDKFKAENMLTASLRGFYAVAENYPNLKADQTMLSLQDNLTETEDKISDARQEYNEEVNRLNVDVQKFPDALVAAVCHFEKAAFFKLDTAEDQQVTAVKF